MGKKLFYFWYFLSSLILTTSIELSCRNLDGEPVDWFAAYKLPSLDNPKNIRTGLDFLYSDPATSEWRFSSRNINDSESAIGATLSQLWTIKDDPQTFYALYNDEHPGSGKSDSNRGHMKGVLAFDDIQGFWMIHSVPNFVNLKASRYSYVESGTRNGQSFLCVTFPVTALTEIGTQLFVAQPSVYDSRLPTSFATLFPDLAKAVRMSKFVGQFSSVKNLASKNGVNFT
uniref:Deoxyribonuclease II n=1 Tax=Panagrolaimus sp. JU765 TaxID=591449 RepID=A0AC34QF00_9BILA